jgi:hypothetical protein
VIVGVLVCAFFVPKGKTTPPRFGLVLPLLAESSAWALLLVPLAALVSFGGLNAMVAVPGVGSKGRC